MKIGLLVAAFLGTIFMTGCTTGKSPIPKVKKCPSDMFLNKKGLCEKYSVKKLGTITKVSCLEYDPKDNDCIVQRLDVSLENGLDILVDQDIMKGKKYKEGDVIEIIVK